MVLVVEDGTGRSDADSLISLAFVDGYHADLGGAAWTGTDADKETAIRRASAFLDASFGWKGWKINGRDQAMAWPRSGVVDEDGYAVPQDAVPDEVQKACSEVALKELTSPGSMTPEYVSADRVKSEKVGSIAVTYDISRTDAESVRPVLLKVQDLISGLLDGGAQTSHLFGEAARA